MSTPQIGSYSFIGNSTPEVLPISTKLNAIEREGIDGSELINIGKRGSPVMWETFADTTDAAALALEYNAISGSLQTVTNISGNSVTSVMVELIGAPQVQTFAKSTGNLKGVTATWRLTPTV